MNDGRLRQILRQGDPAGGNGGLTPDEARAMRRTVLTAVPERKRRLLPVLALTGAVATAVLIAVLVLKPGPAKAPAPPRIAAAPAPPAASIVRPPLPQPEPAPRERTKTARPAHRRRRSPAAPEVADVVASLESTGSPAEAPGTRQVQFSTPGGTKIIWILKSGPAKAGDTRR
jgi:hypothetical protein